MPLKEEKNPQPLLPESGSVFSPTDIDRFLTQMDGGEVMQGQTLLPAAGNEDRAQAVEPPPAQPSAASAKPGRSAKLSEKMQELDGLIEEDIVQRAALDRKVQAGQVAVDRFQRDKSDPSVIVCSEIKRCQNPQFTQIFRK